jgi:hypothetical protein
MMPDTDDLIAMQKGRDVLAKAFPLMKHEQPRRGLCI